MYQDTNSLGLVEVSVILVLMATGFWVFWTFMSWVDPYPERNKTLVSVLADQVTFVWNLLHRIW